MHEYRHEEYPAPQLNRCRVQYIIDNTAKVCAMCSRHTTWNSHSKNLNIVSNACTLHLCIEYYMYYVMKYLLFKLTEHQTDILVVYSWRIDGWFEIILFSLFFVFGYFLSSNASNCFSMCMCIIIIILTTLWFDLWIYGHFDWRYLLGE